MIYILEILIPAQRQEGYASMDINCDGSIMAVATEKNEEEMTIFLEFWYGNSENILINFLIIYLHYGCNFNCKH